MLSLIFAFGYIAVGEDVVAARRCADGRYRYLADPSCPPRHILRLADRNGMKTHIYV